jgi:non-specific serine/threonine protein kinase
LPRPLTSFIGREVETDALVDLVTDPGLQLVTVTGPGGIGKTRLAIHVARKVADRFRDGAVFVALADIREPALLPVTFANALGIRDAIGQALVDRIRDTWSDGHLLVVLDNLEHLLDATPFLSEILPLCPGITVLGTSRQRLQLHGERVFELRPLEQDEALALFEQRAQAIAQGFAITDASRQDVADICDHLDGLPLAIELAAARVPVLPPHAMRARLGNRMELLSAGLRDAPDRHRGMREAIAWSYDLLTPSSQALFRQLAVFEGGFTLDAATAIAGNGNDALGDVAALEAGGLVRLRPDAQGGQRYFMLETIREYALERLRAAGEEADVRQSHAGYVARLVDGTDRVWWVSEDQAKVDEAEVEIANIRAALDWLKRQGDADAVLHLAGSLAPLWAARVYSREGQAWLEWGLPRASAYATPEVILATRALSWILNQQGDLYRSLLLAQQVITISADNPDPLNIAGSLNLSGIAARKLGLADMATSYLMSALTALDPVSGEPWTRTFRCIAMNQLGETALDLGDIGAAEAWFTRTHALQQEFGLRFNHGGHTQRLLGEVARARGDPDHAMRHYRDALQESVDMHDAPMIAILLAGMAGALAATGQYESAGRLFGASEALHERIAMPFIAGMFERQRAFGLPEPWASARTTHGASEPLFLALEARTAAIRSVTLDPDLAAQWWQEGRGMTVDDAVALVHVELPQDAPAPKIPGGLSAREVEVIRLLAQGHSDREIGELLSISHRTVENHVRHIYTKLDLSSRSAATAWAIRHHLA